MIDATFLCPSRVIFNKNEPLLFWHQYKSVYISFQSDTKIRHLFQFSLDKEDIFFSILLLRISVQIIKGICGKPSAGVVVFLSTKPECILLIIYFKLPLEKN